MTVMCYSPPCITARRGRLRHQENAAKPPQPDAGGVVFLLFSIGKPPRPRDQRRLRNIFWVARPPLLAMVQGGEYARFQFVHSFIDRRYSRQPEGSVNVASVSVCSFACVFALLALPLFAQHEYT